MKFLNVLLNLKFSDVKFYLNIYVGGGYEWMNLNLYLYMKNINMYSYIWICMYLYICLYRWELRVDRLFVLL